MKQRRCKSEQIYQIFLQNQIKKNSADPILLNTEDQDPIHSFYYTYEPIPKVCGKLEQKYFYLLSSKRLKKDIQIINILAQKIYIQCFTSSEQIFKKIKSVQGGQKNALFYIIDLQNQLKNKQLKQIVSDATILNIYRKKVQIQLQRVISIQSHQQLKQILLQKRKQRSLQIKCNPNYNIITGKQKSFINKLQFNFKLMFQLKSGKQMLQAKKDCLKFVKQWLQWRQEGFQLSQEHFISYEEFQQFLNNLSEDEQHDEIILNFYTKDNFLHRLINRGLRSLQSCTQIIYLQYLFVRIYRAVNKIFKQASISSLLQTGPNKQTFLTSYRSCFLSAQQISLAKKSEGQFVQLQGFISASLKRQQTKKFDYGNFLIITIPQDVLLNKSKSKISGFAVLGDRSQFKQQMQILYNPNNIYKVVQVQQQKGTIKLQICDIDLLNTEQAGAEGIPSHICELIKYNNFKNKTKIQNQGDVLFLSGFPSQTVYDYYNQQLLIKINAIYQQNKDKKYKFQDYDLNQNIMKNVEQLSYELVSKYKDFIKFQFNLSENNLIQNVSSRFICAIEYQTQDFHGLFQNIAEKISQMRIDKIISYSFLCISRQILKYKLQCDGCLDPLQKHKNQYFTIKNAENCLYFCKHYFYIGEFQQCRNLIQNNYLTQFMQIEGIRNTILHAKLLKGCGALYLKDNNNLKSIQALEQSYDIFLKNGQNQAIQAFQIKFNIAICYYNIGKYSKSLKQIKICLIAYQNSFGINHPDYHFILSFYFRICFIIEHKFQYDKNFVQNTINKKLKNMSEISYQDFGILNNIIKNYWDCKHYVEIQNLINPFLDMVKKEQKVYCYEILSMVYCAKYYIGKVSEYNKIKQIILNKLKQMPVSSQLTALFVYLSTQYNKAQYKLVLIYFQQIQKLNITKPNISYQLSLIYWYASKIQLDQSDKEDLYKNLLHQVDQLRNKQQKINFMYIYQSLKILSETQIHLLLYYQALNTIKQAQNIISQKKITKDIIVSDINFLQSKLFFINGNYFQAQKKLYLCKQIIIQNYGLSNQRYNKVYNLQIQIKNQQTYIKSCTDSQQFELRQQNF